MSEDVARSIVYLLSDPRTGFPKYVGKSSSGLKRARQLHSAKCGSWQKSLLKLGLKPTVDVLEETAEINDAERFWIGYFQMIGCQLLNMTAGGDGLPPGWKMSESTKRKMSAAHTGVKKTLEHRRHIGIALQGRISPMKGKKITENTREKMRNARRKYWAARS